MSDPAPHEAVVGRRGRWVWDADDDRGLRPLVGGERPPAVHGTDLDYHWDGRHGVYERQVIWRLTLTMIGVWGLWAVVGGSAFLLFRWLRLACWLTGCSP